MRAGRRCDITPWPCHWRVVNKSLGRLTPAQWLLRWNNPNISCWIFGPVTKKKHLAWSGRHVSNSRLTVLLSCRWGWRLRTDTARIWRLFAAGCTDDETVIMIVIVVIIIIVIMLSSDTAFHHSHQSDLFKNTSSLQWRWSPSPLFLESLEDCFFRCCCSAICSETAAEGSLVNAEEVWLPLSWLPCRLETDVGKLFSTRNDDVANLLWRVLHSLGIPYVSKSVQWRRCVNQC